MTSYISSGGTLEIDLADPISKIQAKKIKVNIYYNLGYDSDEKKMQSVIYTN